MRKIILIISHDPGGYDVTFPVYNYLIDNNHPAQFICVGPAGQINPLYKKSEADTLSFVNELILQNRISLLITGTSWGSDFELDCILICKEFSIPTVSILDYWSNYANRFFYEKHELYVYPDHYIIMDNYARSQMLREEVPPEIIRVLGHPGLDRFIAMKNREQSARNKTCRVLFLSQPLSELYGLKLGYNETTVVDDLIALAETNELELHVKFHPKDHSDFIQKYNRLIVVGNLSELVSQYDLVIGMSTIGLLHSALMGIQAISYQPNLVSEDLCISNTLGLTKLITTFEELHDYLGEIKKTDASINWFQQQRYDSIWMDGRSCERIYHFIKGVISYEN